jgi:hypothetical protein
MTDEERDARLMRMEQMLSALLERQQVKEFYEIDEFARLVGRQALRSGSGADLDASRGRSGKADEARLSRG